MYPHHEFQQDIPPQTGREAEEDRRTREFGAVKAVGKVPGAVVEFIPRPADPVTERERYDLLQLRESERVNRIADELAPLIFGQSWHGLSDRAKADCRYAASKLQREHKTCWKRAAQLHAVESLVQSLEEDPAFASLTLPSKVAFSRRMVGQVIAAYHGILEGTYALMPGTYLDIVDGTQVDPWEPKK